MGGVSQGSAEFYSGALRLTGKVSTENNGGFIQVRTRVNSNEAKGKTGIKIKVKGNGDIYYLHVRNASSRLLGTIIPLILKLLINGRKC